MTILLRGASRASQISRASQRGVVTRLRDLCSSVVEMTVEVDDRIPWRPGQSVRLSLPGGAEREYCPTFGLQGEADEFQVRFHVRRHPGGAFSSQVGGRLREGVRLAMSAPMGDFFLRQAHGPLVLVGAGEGFAPIWAMAVAARLGQPDRPLTVIVAAQDPRDMYMRPALAWLRARGVTDVHAVAHDATRADLFLSAGRPAEVLPALTPDHEVHVAGLPADVAEVEAAAMAAGAPCYAQAFVPAAGAASADARVKRTAAVPALALMA